MKRIFFIGLIAFLLTGCQELAQTGKHLKSSMVGLQRKATLYNTNGEIIKQWEGKFQVETGDGGYCRFMLNNKTVYISGTYTIEEL